MLVDNERHLFYVTLIDTADPLGPVSAAYYVYADTIANAATIALAETQERSLRLMRVKAVTEMADELLIMYSATAFEQSRVIE